MHHQHRSNDAPITVRVDPRHAELLRDHIEAGAAGLFEQLAEAPDRLRDPAGSRAWAVTCRRIIEGLGRPRFVADGRVRAVLLELNQVNDEANDYERGVAEHEAFAHLLRQFDHAGRD